MDRKRKHQQVQNQAQVQVRGPFQGDLHDIQTCRKTDPALLGTYKSDYITLWGWLMYLESDPILKSRMCLGLNDGSFLTFTYTDGWLTISPGIIKELHDCVAAGKRFILNLLHIKMTEEEHSNALIFDTHAKTLTRFEPHGSLTRMYDMDPLDAQLRTRLKEILPEYTYVPPSAYCPREGPQTVEGYHAWRRLTQGTPLAQVGYCGAWSLLFLHTRLVFPDLSDAAITAKLLTGHNLRERIESYATFILSKLDRNWYRQKCERYEGGVDQQGKARGKGVLYLRNGGKYTGDFKHGVPDGEGVKTYPDGASYIGTFKNGFSTGYGVYSKEGDYSYEGEWLDGYYNGLGTYTSLGFKYTGQWRKNAREGKGESWDSGDHYTGGFKKNQYHGKEGVLTRRNGDLLEGTFRDGAFRKGTVRYADGSIFEGDYDRSPVDGVLIWPENTDATFSGEFQEGRPFNGTFVLEGEEHEITEGRPEVDHLIETKRLEQAQLMRVWQQQRAEQARASKERKQRRDQKAQQRRSRQAQQRRRRQSDQEEQDQKVVIPIRFDSDSDS